MGPEGWLRSTDILVIASWSSLPVQLLPESVSILKKTNVVCVIFRTYAEARTQRRTWRPAASECLRVLMTKTSIAHSRDLASRQATPAAYDLIKTPSLAITLFWNCHGITGYFHGWIGFRILSWNNTERERCFTRLLYFLYRVPKVIRIQRRRRFILISIPIPESQHVLFLSFWGSSKGIVERRLLKKWLRQSVQEFRVVFIEVRG